MIKWKYYAIHVQDADGAMRVYYACLKKMEEEVE